MRVTALPAPRVCQPSQHAGDEITHNASRIKNHSGVQQQQADHQNQHYDQLERMPPARTDLLSAPRTASCLPSKILYPESTQSTRQRFPRIVDGRSIEEVDHRSDHSSTRRDRHSDKVLFARTSWVPRLWIHTDIEAAPAGTHLQIRKRKQTKTPRCNSRSRSIGSTVIGSIRNPHIYARRLGCHAKRDHICQRVQLLAEVARRSRPSRNLPIHPIEQHRKADRQCRPIERGMIGHRTLNRLCNRVVPRGDIGAKVKREGRTNIPSARPALCLLTVPHRFLLSAPQASRTKLSSIKLHRCRHHRIFHLLHLRQKSWRAPSCRQSRAHPS